MVKGFEQHTSKMTEAEIQLAHQLIPAFMCQVIKCDLINIIEC